MLSSNTVLPVKSLIAIIMGVFFFCFFFVQKLNLIVKVIVVSDGKGGWSHLILILNCLSGRLVLDSCTVLIFCLVLIFNCLSGGYVL